MTKFERLFVWTGGALFVGSLLAFAWWYGVTLAEPRPWAGWPAVAVNTLIFTVFALHHSLFARASVKALVTRVVPAPLLRSFYVWVASVLFVLVFVFWQPVGGVLYRSPAWLTVALALVQLSGVWLIARSVSAIDALELAGIRSSRKTGALQTAGPYGLVRHPLYLGWMIVVFGAGGMTGDRLAFAIISSAYLIVAVPWEERSLEDAFGPSYTEYKRRVTWRVIPYVF